MPKKIDESEIHKGCKVSGHYRLADGSAAERSIKLTPERNCIFNGSYYDQSAVKVHADQTGAWSVVLPPSEHAGLYSFEIGNSTFKLRVPDRVEAHFTELIIES